MGTEGRTAALFDAKLGGARLVYLVAQLAGVTL